MMQESQGIPFKIATEQTLEWQRVLLYTSQGTFSFDVIQGLPSINGGSQRNAGRIQADMVFLKGKHAFNQRILPGFTPKCVLQYPEFYSLVMVPNASMVFLQIRNGLETCIGNISAQQTLIQLLFMCLLPTVIKCYDQVETSPTSLSIVYLVDQMRPFSSKSRHENKVLH